MFSLTVSEVSGQDLWATSPGAVVIQDIMVGSSLYGGQEVENDRQTDRPLPPTHTRGGQREGEKMLALVAVPLQYYLSYKLINQPTDEIGALTNRVPSA